MKIGSVIFIAASMIASAPLMGQKTENSIQSGNTLYKEQKYDQAEIQYNDVLTKEPANTTAKFNLANALYRRGKQDESAKKLDELIAYEKETALRSQSFYNKGVILSAQKKLEESIEAYKNTLRLNPDDKDARENLQKALLELKKKNPPKKEDKKKKQEQQKKQPQPKMNQKEAQQRLKLLEQKEKEVQQRMQKEKSKTGGGQIKDW
jgi:Ca-activated chloride channel family protein